MLEIHSKVIRDGRSTKRGSMGRWIVIFVVGRMQSVVLGVGRWHTAEKRVRRRTGRP